MSVDSSDRAAVLVAGSDAPEKPNVRVGFMALTDCASIVMAAELGLDRRHGVSIVPVRQTSWASVRDTLLRGDVDLAQALYGLVVGTDTGACGPRAPMAVLMTLNRNGQGLNLSRRLASAGVRDLESLAALLRTGGVRPTFAHTFPGGTHAMWLNYWLASAGIDPRRDVETIAVPPPQMVASAKAGRMDGFCVGEPWSHRALVDGVAVLAAASQDVWPDHPEKVLAATAGFADKYPNTCRAVVAAVLEASRWIDASDANRMATARVITDRRYVDTSVGLITERILGRYQDGLGRDWRDPRPLRFHDDGAVNPPYLSDAMWFLTQHKRWGLLAEHPDYPAVARRVNRLALYADAAVEAGVAMPVSPMRTSTLIDGRIWNGSDPRGYADGVPSHVACATP